MSHINRYMRRYYFYKFNLGLLYMFIQVKFFTYRCKHIKYQSLISNIYGTVLCISRSPTRVGIRILYYFTIKTNIAC